MPNDNRDGDSGKDSGSDQQGAVDRVKERVIRALKQYVGEEPGQPDAETTEQLSCRQKYRARDLEPPPPKLRRKS